MVYFQGLLKHLFLVETSQRIAVGILRFMTYAQILCHTLFLFQVQQQKASSVWLLKGVHMDKLWIMTSQAAIRITLVCIQSLYHALLQTYQRILRIRVPSVNSTRIKSLSKEIWMVRNNLRRLMFLQSHLAQISKMLRNEKRDLSHLKQGVLSSAA